MYISNCLFLITYEYAIKEEKILHNNNYKSLVFYKYLIKVFFSYIFLFILYAYFDVYGFNENIIQKKV